jgi:hypothetical protein
MKKINSFGGGFYQYTKNEVELGITHRYPVKLIAHFFMFRVRKFKKIGGFWYVLILNDIKYNVVLLSVKLIHTF